MTERRIFRVQLAVVFAIIAILNLAYYREHDLLRVAQKDHLPIAVHGWDGLAWFVWLPAAPATLALIRRYPLTGERLKRNLFRLALGLFVIYLAVTNARYLFRIFPTLWASSGGWRSFDWPTYWRTQLIRLPLDFITDCGFIAASFAIDYYFRYQRRTEEVRDLEIRAARLQSEVAQTQLAILRGQIQPHFLFNTLNAIATLVQQRQNEIAVRMMVQLSALLRRTIEIDAPELTLEGELGSIHSYFEIERIRFGEKLRVEIAVDPPVLRCLLPSLLLLPLVENAVKHGIAKRIEPGQVRLRARGEGRRLLLEVSNDGPADPESPESGSEGIGLQNTRRRLDHAYGDDYRLEIGGSAAGCTVVRLDLPWREAAPALS